MILYDIISPFYIPSYITIIVIPQENADFSVQPGWYFDDIYLRFPGFQLVYLWLGVARYDAICINILK